MRTRGIITCAALILSLLLAAACGNNRGGQTRVAPATAAPPVARTLPPLPSRPLSPKLKEMRARAVRAAAELRELPFREEVGMAELSGWEYGTRASEMAHVLGGEELRALGQLAAAGGVLPEGTDLASLAASFTAVSAGAVYSPLDKQVLIVDKFRDDSLLTHEFTHALQDQHFDLMKVLVVRPYSFDRAEAAFAVIEGDAMNVQRRLERGESYGRLPLDEISKEENERFGDYRREIGRFFPPLLTETFIFRYRDGARFVESVRRAKGERGVDALFQRPPASTEQILHPEKYDANEAPREVAPLEAVFAADGWRMSASTPLGEIGVRGLLMAGVPSAEAARAAAGWGGDRAYLFEKTGSAPLFVWQTVWDKPADAEEFFTAYNRLRSRAGAKPVESPAAGETSQAAWREAGRFTIVRRTGDAVLIIRGAEQDAKAAMEK
ncbi:MAG TPA: hypothetical protein VN256_04920 [Pyrinomonadaceae bacterium]|nr:hypothetical protein [Pyrinomonadaceae bacterium]